VPADFGVFAVALVVLNAGLSMNELGVSLAIIRWREGVGRIAPTVTTLALVWSGLLYATCYLGAPWFAEALNAPTATPLIRVLALGILFDAIASVPAALITRQFMQRTRMVIDTLGFMASTVVSVVLALLGLGAWCIVWGYITSSLVSTCLTLRCAPGRYSPGFDRGVAKELLSFGLPLAGSSALLFLMLNVDYVVVGHTTDSEQLGYYLLAFNLCSWPVTLISVAIRRVSLAGFSRISHEPTRAGVAFSRAAGLVMAATLTLSAGLAAYASPVIDVLYGPNWAPAADVLRFLCVLGAGRVGAELAYDYLVAMGHTRVNFVVQMVWLAVLVPVLIVAALHAGIVGVAVGHAVVVLVVILPLYLVILSRAHVPMRMLLVVSWRPVAAALLIVASSLPILAMFNAAVVQLIVGGFVSLMICLVLLTSVVREGKALISRAEHASTAPSGA
jgi:PST family polysaccharide transporter